MVTYMSVYWNIENNIKYKEQKIQNYLLTTRNLFPVLLDPLYLYSFLIHVYLKYLFVWLSEKL